MKTLENTVTMVCHRYTPFPAGGADRQAQGVAEILVRRGWGIRVLTTRLPGTEPREVINGVYVRRLLSPFIPKVQGTFFLANVFWNLITGPRGQIIHLNQMYREVLPSLLVRRLRGCPIVICVSCGGAYGDIGRLKTIPFGRWMLRLSRHADAVVSLSDQITRELLDEGFEASRIVKIPNAVDTSRYVPSSAEERKRLRQELHLPLEGQLVIFTGRLHFQKAIDRLIRAWKDVAVAQPDAHLLILGEGPEEAKLRELSAECGLGQTVHFLGHIEGVLPYLRASDVFVLASLFEGVSLSMLEAMACGLPVVTTNIGGTCEAIRDNVDGLLVEPDNISALATRLIEALSDPAIQQCIGAQARKRVEELYSMEHCSTLYGEMYERLGTHQQVAQPGMNVAGGQEISSK